MRFEAIFWREIRAICARLCYGHVRPWNVEENKMEACVSAVPFSPSPARSEWSLAKFLLCLLAVILCSLSETLSAQLSSEKSLVFGPGVHPERAGFPVNYFYIQAVDSEGKK